MVVNLRSLIFCWGLLVPFTIAGCVFGGPQFDPETHDFRCDDLLMRLTIDEAVVNRAAGATKTDLSLKIDPDSSNPVALELDFDDAPLYLLARQDRGEAAGSPPPDGAATVKPLNVFLPPSQISPAKANQVQACVEMQHAYIADSINKSQLFDVRVTGYRVGEQRVYWRVEEPELHPIFRNGDSSLEIWRNGLVYISYRESIGGFPGTSRSLAGNVRNVKGSVEVDCCSQEVAPQIDASKFVDEQGQNVADYLGVPISDFSIKP